MGVHDLKLRFCLPQGPVFTRFFSLLQDLQGAEHSDEKCVAIVE